MFVQSRLHVKKLILLSTLLLSGCFEVENPNDGEGGTPPPPPPPPPTLSHLATGTMGHYQNAGGYTVANTSATSEAETATVHVTETIPTGFVPQVITYPYAFSSLTLFENVDVVKDEILFSRAIERTFDELINDHFLLVVDPQNSIAPAAHQTALENDECPLDSSDLLTTAVLNINLSGMDVSNIAYYCSEHSLYWVKHEQTGIVGTILQWLGPFQPGEE
jgi:hypothetical protein